MKPLPNKPLRPLHRCKNLVMLAVLVLSSLSMFLAPSDILAQSGSSGQSTLPARNRHYFLVRLETGNIRDNEDLIKSAFLNNGFTLCETDANNQSIRLIGEKGASIERVQSILKELGLTLKSHQEAYTNQTPVFFR
ncbi:MAG: hypothetical protein RL213_2331 [Bacteroidota bacterium]